MIIKITHLTNEKLEPFRVLSSSMGSCATLALPGTYLFQLKECGINERGTPRNILLGCTITQPSGSQLGIETSFFDTKDKNDNSDLHIVNFIDKTLISYYQGWGTWSDVYGNNHWQQKDYLRTTGTVSDPIV